MECARCELVDGWSGKLKEPQAKPLDAKPAASHKKAVTWVEMSPNGKEMITASNGRRPRPE